MVWLENLFQQIRRRAFRGYVHDPAAMNEVASDGGRLRETLRHRGLAWQVAGFTTTAA